MSENRYQGQLIRRIKAMMPDAVVMKLDSGYIQGIPDLAIFMGPNWGMLEVKKNFGARHQPNQEYYVRLFNDMSFAAFIYPENEEEILRALQQALER